ncbi:hypothetical protein brsh051_20830 [Brooklawnia propionicigenes]|uniref:DUF4913 domain-containing protein n=1 Tax=Brooklawnia propionicigenes TaxID=3041175 RepID=A0AAN0MHJ3_9ACTN|nr:DUF4913 domain-containing protein [Brooklawnia sp. SH051]BEH02802.1 hypothetical protein brsh051_20830 [Brooklawnia sp. SH051]
MTGIPDWTTDPEWPTDHPTTPQSETSEAVDEADNDATPETEPPPELYFGSTDEFVREFVCPVFRRTVGEAGRAEYRWSARWWESAEAVIRLEAMWRSWEQARLDPATGISTWLRDHADYHLSVLMSPTGPFASSRDTATVNGHLPYTAPPPGLFPDVRAEPTG